MAKREILRGMRGVRTLSGINKVNNIPHQVYMKISALEMEKLRHQQEKVKAIQRIQAINKRVQEIDAEVTELLVAINPSGSETRTYLNSTTNTSITQLPPKSATKYPRINSQMVIKY